jgi:hypothetical protein
VQGIGIGQRENNSSEQELSCVGNRLKRENPGSRKPSGNELRRSECNCPTVSSIQQAARSLEYCNYVELRLRRGKRTAAVSWEFVVDWHINIFYCKSRI